MADDARWACGVHAVTELLRRRPADVQELRLQAGRRDKRLGEIRALARKAAIPVQESDKSDLDRLSPAPHQGVLALTRGGERSLSEKDLPALLDAAGDAPLLLVLDGITDPHNLGACLRTADAAGVAAVIAPKDKAVGLNATVRKVASGAAENIPFIAVTNLARCLDALKERGIWLVGTDDSAERSLFEQELTGAIALVMGAEGSGLRRLTRESCDYLVALPMAGSVSSLNVSVATGVALFEAVRQRR